MNKYELMFIVKTAAEGETYTNLVENYKKVITNAKGEISNSKDMGKRKLAYEINKEVSGLYYVVDFTANTDTVKELDRLLRLDENIIRHMIIRTDAE